MSYAKFLQVVKENSLGPKTPAFMIGEKVGVVVFALQELVISGLYIFGAWRFLQLQSILQRPIHRQTMKLLIIANLLVVMLDLSLVCFEYLSLWGL